MSLLQAVLSRSEEVVTPGGVAVCFAPQFATERLERLAPQQPQHNVNLPVSRPPGFAPKVVLVFVVHRHECHFGPPLFSVQLPRGRKTSMRHCPTSSEDSSVASSEWGPGAPSWQRRRRPPDSARVNIYVPPELGARLARVLNRGVDINFSKVCQDALKENLDQIESSLLK